MSDGDAGGGGFGNAAPAGSEPAQSSGDASGPGNGGNSGNNDNSASSAGVFATNNDFSDMAAPYMVNLQNQHQGQVHDDAMDRPPDPVRPGRPTRPGHYATGRQHKVDIDNYFVSVP